MTRYGHYPVDEFGFPEEDVELRTFSNGQYVGRFMLIPKPGPGHPSAPASSPWPSPTSPATPLGSSPAQVALNPRQQAAR